MATTLSVAYEHREAFRLFFEAVNKYMPKNIRVYRANVKQFKDSIINPLLNLAKAKLESLFTSDYMKKFHIEFDFFTYAINGNAGGTEFNFGKKPELKFLVNFNRILRTLYKTDIRAFCLTLADVYTHELSHCIQYIKQYKSLGIQGDLLKDSIFKNKEHLFEHDSRYFTKSEYYEDLPYFSKHEELICYSKDAARELLTIYRDKKIVFNKLSIVDSLKELSEASDCFYYYYDCFCIKVPGLKQYELLWRRFIKHLCRNLNEDFSI